MKNIIKSTLMLLCGVALFASCDDDRDSNPILNTSGDVTFHLNAPAIGGAALDLAKSEGVELSWSQPQLSEDNAPFGQAGVYGFSYVAQLSTDGNFTKSFSEALAEVTDEEGNYTGTPTGQDFTTLPAKYTSCTSVISAAEINRGLNELYVYAQDALPESQHVYIRMAAILSKTTGEDVILATSNTQELNTTDLTWIDVTAQPVEVGYLWVPGAGNGWDHGVAPILVAEDGVTFKGYAYLKDEFKFTLQDNWDEEYNNGSFTSTTENIDCGDGAGGNIAVTEAGMYWLEVTPSKGELIATPVKWGVVGAFNSWSVDDGKIIDMTYDETNHCLTATTDFDSDSEFKFARDNAWTVNFGGSLDALEQDGPNFTASAGTHTFQLFIERPSVDGYHAVVK